MTRRVVMSDAIDFMQSEPDESYDTIYIDPPFNTGAARKGKSGSYPDRFTDYTHWFYTVMANAHRIIKRTGCIFVHMDQHEVFDVKVKVMDPVFGKKNFLNHIVWSYDYGGRGKDRWPCKHDDILFYAKDEKKHHFDWDAAERIPYMAPELQKDPIKAARGKLPTDVWWMSIVGTQSKERIGYPTQKPVKLIQRALQPTTPTAGKVLDFFAGSGTTGQAAINLGLEFTLVDSNPEAIQVIRTRLTPLDSGIEFIV